MLFPERRAARAGDDQAAMRDHRAAAAGDLVARRAAAALSTVAGVRGYTGGGAAVQRSARSGLAARMAAPALTTPTSAWSAAPRPAIPTAPPAQGHTPSFSAAARRASGSTSSSRIMSPSIASSRRKAIIPPSRQSGAPRPTTSSPRGRYRRRISPGTSGAARYRPAPSARPCPFRARPRAALH